jgi:penicillin-binding protein 1C
VTGAGPIFHDVMMAAVERIRGALPIGDRTAIIGPPADVDEVEVCALSGLAPGSACPTRIREWVPQGASLTQCTWHHHADEGTSTVWPDEYRHWARAEGLLTPPSGAWARGFETPASAETEVVAARARDTGRETQPAGVGLRIVAPLAGALYLVDPSLRREFQALPLRATGAAAGPLEWFVNGASVGRFHADEPARWPMVRGEHANMVKDTAGRTADTRIVVR